MNETLTVYTMNLSYDTLEDRLSLLLTNDEQSINLWLTRSLTQRLLKGLSDLLVHQSDVESQQAKAREAATIMEHLAITQRHSQSPDRLAADTPTPIHRGLLTKVDIQYSPNQYHLLFFAQDTCIAQMPTGRAGLHRIIDLFERMSERANWQLIDVNLGWLARKETALADMPVVGHC